MKLWQSAARAAQGLDDLKVTFEIAKSFSAGQITKFVAILTAEQQAQFLPIAEHLVARMSPKDERKVVLEEVIRQVAEDQRKTPTPDKPKKEEEPPS